MDIPTILAALVSGGLIGLILGLVGGGCGLRRRGLRVRLRGQHQGRGRERNAQQVSLQLHDLPLQGSMDWAWGRCPPLLGHAIPVRVGVDAADSSRGLYGPRNAAYVFMASPGVSRRDPHQHCVSAMRKRAAPPLRRRARARPPVHIAMQHDPPQDQPTCSASRQVRKAFKVRRPWRGSACRRWGASIAPLCNTVPGYTTSRFQRAGTVSTRSNHAPPSPG